MSEDRALARGLAWFGIGLGVIELVAPRGLARAIGLEGHERTLQLFGLREIAAGVAMLASDAPEQRIGLRVAGDVLDGGLLSTGLTRSNPRHIRTLMAAVAVAPVVILDAACWQRVRERSKPMSSGAPDASAWTRTGDTNLRRGEGGGTLSQKAQ